MDDSENYETTFNHFLLHFVRYLCNFCPNTCSQTGHTDESVAFRCGYLSTPKQCQNRSSEIVLLHDKRLQAREISEFGAQNQHG